MATSGKGKSVTTRAAARGSAGKKAAPRKAARKPRAAFRLSSPDFRPNGRIAMAQVFNGFGCSGQNRSPELRWRGAPAGTQSFALLVHDPDAPTGGAGWWHWLVLNIPADCTGLPGNAGRADGSGLPAGAMQVETDFGAPGWGGPCPPAGDKPHRYIFTLYALKTARIDASPSGASLAGFMVNMNTLAKTTLTGRFGRAK